MTNDPRFIAQPFLTRPLANQLRKPDASEEEHDQIVRVRVVGELDLATAPALSGELIAAGRHDDVHSARTSPPSIQLDLSGLTFIDIGGLGALTDARRALLRLGCRLCLTSPDPRPLRVLDLAVRAGWLPRDLECASCGAWPPVSRPLRLPAKTYHRVELGRSRR